MKYVLYPAVFALLILFSCGENGNDESAEGKNTIEFRNVSDDPDTIILERVTEKYYGVDYEGDTVIYERDGKILTSGVVTGTFHHMERGDFMHFIMEDSNGLLHSFFMNTENQRQMDKYYEGYEPARGHPVTVKWERSALPISESGAMLTVYQAKEIVD